MGRGPRMEPMLYATLRQKILSLSSEAVRIHLGSEIRPERMKNYLLRIAHELDMSNHHPVGAWGCDLLALQRGRSPAGPGDG